VSAPLLRAALLAFAVLDAGVAPAAPAVPAAPAAISAPPRTTAAGVPIIDLPETPAQLALGAAWQAEALPQLPASSDVIGPARLVALYRETAAARPARGRAAAAAPLGLIVLRFDAPNPRAWRDKTRAAYLDEIEAGLVAACPTDSACRGLKRLKRSVSESEAVPVMDLHLRDAGGTQRLYRFLFFRTYAILAAVELPPKSPSAALSRARRALASFTVQPAWQR
jgi:hypothetical protein